MVEGVLKVAVMIVLLVGGPMYTVVLPTIEQCEQQKKLMSYAIAEAKGKKVKTVQCMDAALDIYDLDRIVALKEKYQ